MMTTYILVIEPTNNEQYRQYFYTTFNIPYYSLDIANSIPEAEAMLNRGNYSYVFIGDIDSTSWIDLTKFGDAICDIVSFTQDPELYEAHKRGNPLCRYVPFPKLPFFMSLEKFGEVQRR